MTVQDIKEKIRLGRTNEVTPSQLGAAISRDKFLLFNFMMDNNLADVNQALRVKLGQDYLPFAPDRKKIEAVINTYIVKENNQAMQTLIDEFDYDKNANNYTTNPAVLAAIKLK